MRPRHLLALIVFSGDSACGSGKEGTPSRAEAADDTAVDTAQPDDDAPPVDTDTATPTTVEATPAVLERGETDPRCPFAVTVQLTAVGDEAPGAATLTAPPGWSTDALPPLAAGATVPLTFYWDGTQNNPAGALVIAFEHADSVTVDIHATPAIPTTQLDLDLSPRTDANLLLAVDRSCNMDDMARLAPHWPVLRDQLRDAGISLRMAAVVEDDACVLGDSIVLDDTLDDDTFRANLWTQQNWAGEWGWYTEQLLDLSARALEADCNAALVAADAPLHVLAFSDEPDQSDDDWSVYVARMQARTEPGVPLTVHGIGGGVSATCAAMHYSGVIEATEATAGVFLDFCTDDWAAGLTNLAAGIAEAGRRVVLHELVDDAASITVRQGGVARTGWTYADGILTLPQDVDLTGSVAVEVVHAPSCGAD